MRAGILTLSDKGAEGLRVDTSAHVIRQWLSDRGVETVNYEILPDEKQMIASKLLAWADSDLMDVIVTTGGTGVSPRDVTPEATSSICDRLIPGMGELMRSKSLDKTPMAALSRAVAGVRARTLIINLPGSPKGAIENLEAVWPVVWHLVEKIQGDETDCAQTT